MNEPFSLQTEAWLRTCTPELCVIIKRFERVEEWCADADSPPLRDGLEKLQKLYRPEVMSPGDLDRMLLVLAHLHVSPALHLMYLFGQDCPSFSGDVLLHARKRIEEQSTLEPEARVMEDRLQKLAAVHLFATLFGTETRRRVLDCLHSIQKERSL